MKVMHGDVNHDGGRCEVGEAEVEAAGIGNRTPRPGSLHTRISLYRACVQSKDIQS